MDLYPPLSVPRPIVEPELFASLRPPEYTGPLSGQETRWGALPGGMLGGLGGLGALGALGAAGGGGFGGGKTAAAAGPAAGMAGNPYQRNRPTAGADDDDSSGPGPAKRRLTYEEYEKRRQEKQQAAKDGDSKGVGDFRQGIVRAATAEEVAGRCRYTIDHGVTLPRQKSALLPIIDQAVLCSRVSIFNKAVDEKFPLLGFRFKNESGQSLMQGPIAVYDQGAYTGDARIADLQPNEQRLLSYAVDLGMEVKATTSPIATRLAVVKIRKGTVEMSDRLRAMTDYAVVNRSPEERVLLLEHPVRENWRLVSPQPVERARDVYRFQVKVSAGAALRYVVTEESDIPRKIELSALDDPTTTLLLHAEAASPQLRAAIGKAKELRTRLTDTQNRELDVRNQFNRIAADQGRLRANLAQLPATSAVYKRYLDKFDTQETKIEKLEAQLNTLRQAVEQQLKEYESYMSQLTVD